MNIEKRYGRQTPTVGFTLPYKATKGHEAIELYERSGRTAFEWQKALIYDILGQTDDGLWVHSRFGFSVPRQNGKNEIITIREIYGLFNGERILHTAHRTMTSRAAWERCVMLLEKSGIHEIRGECKSGYSSGKSRGQEWIEMDDAHGGGRVSYRTRSSTGGLGETYDCLVIDEAQEYQDDQESALKYTIVSSQNPQTLFLGTPPTPYSSGTIFPDFRRDILTGARKNAGWAEWSIEEKADAHDVDAWYETNPSLGYTLTERAIEDEIGEDVNDFNIQRLGLWISYNQKSAISLNEWNACLVDSIDIIGKLSVGIKFAKDGGSVSLAVAGKRRDERTFVECYACRTMRDGVDWICQFLKSINGQYVKVVADGQNGLDLLTKAVKDYKLKPIYIATVKDVVSAAAAFELGINQKTLVHMEQVSATQVVTNCEKRAIGSNGGFGYKATSTDYDISILESMMLAAWAVDSFKETGNVRVSY